jgi:short-subunit dehydrogenase
VTTRSPHTILITGATGAIGSALARTYATSGVRLILHGRNPDRLQEVRQACERLGAVADCFTLDVRCIEPLRTWVREVDRATPLDLVIANAGMNTDIGADGRGEAWEAAEALLDTNIRATMALVDAVLPGMRARKSGQIALISSLAGYFGLPVTPSYCASKAAVKAYGEALRGWLAAEDIRINVVMPGYVDSAMCRAMPGPKPFLLRPERAAWLIRTGLEKNKARISFPFPLNLGTWALAVLPAPLSQRFVRWAGYGG